MGFGPFSSESKTSKTVQTTTVSDQAQLVGRGSRIAQGGATQVLNSNLGTSINRSNLAPVLRGRNNTITYNTGVDQEVLTGLVDNLTTATTDQIAAASKNTADQIAAVAAANQSQSSQLSDLLSQQSQSGSGELDTLTGLLTQKTDTESGNPKLLAWVAIAAIAAIALVIFYRK